MLPVSFICLCQLFQTIHVVNLKYPHQETIFFLIERSFKDVFIFYLNIFYAIFHLDKSFFFSEYFIKKIFLEFDRFYVNVHSKEGNMQFSISVFKTKNLLTMYKIKN